jgi:polyphenol oxidase
MIQSKLLDAEIGIKYYFTTREFGFSNTPYKSLNFGFHVGDDKSHVQKNHKMINDYFQTDHTIFMNQVHSNSVEIIDSNTIAPVTCDALISNQKNVALMVMSADCTPILLYDKKKGVIAAIHAGRAGAFQNIIKESIQKFIFNYKCKPENIIAVLGPAIHQCCYEINREIFDEAKKLGYAHAIKTFDEHYYLDVNTILHKQLLECGLHEINIEIINRCTACETEMFFSYRKEGITGRMASVIMKK